MSQLNDETNSLFMVKPVITLQELSLVFCTEEGSRIYLSSDILKQNRIIPNDWELSHSSVTTNEFTQLIFTNGVRLISQDNSITFIEPLMSFLPNEIRIADIAQKYITVFSQINYREVNINIKNFVRFESSARSSKELVHQYLLSLLSYESLLNPKPRPITTAIDLVYDFERVILTFNIKEVELHLPNNKVVSNVLFYGIVSHKIKATSTSEKLQQLSHSINSWKADLGAYTKVLNGFLRQPKS